MQQPIFVSDVEPVATPTTQRDMRLHGVSQTLLIPLWARGVESKKAHPIVNDPRAREIVDAMLQQSEDFDFSPLRRAYGTQLGCVVRGLLYDQWVNDFLDVHKTGTIVELGAGLTTRFERIDRGLGKGRWVDIDLPNVIALRKQMFAADYASSPRRLHIAQSVTDTTWMTMLKRVAPAPYFFVSEGMLMYLAPTDVRALFSKMATAFPDSTMAFDSIAPVVMKNQHHHDSMKHMMDAPFKWGVDDVRIVEQWDPRLTILETANLAEIASRFRSDVPLPHRTLAKAIRVMLPWLARSYRLARMQLAA